MGDATTYLVTLRLATEGSLAAGLTGVDTKATSASRALADVSVSAKGAGETLMSMTGRAGDALASVADRALEVGMSVAKMGAVAIAGLATYGVAHLNNELEQTQISLAAIGQAQGFTSTFAGGMQLAAYELAKMKQDVKTLPGDLGQLSDMMKTIATPAAQAGASMDKIRELSGRTMLTAAILGVPQEVASREMARLLTGGAGAHNILGTRLGFVGDRVKTFNAEAPAQRLKDINTEMDKYQGAADRFGSSFVANWTTLKDNIKYVLLAPATAPLFEKVKGTMADINAYFDSHKDKIDSIVHLVGGKLADSWTLVVDKLKALEPLFERIGSWLINLDPAKVGQAVSHIGAGLLGAKVLGGGVSMVSGVAGSAMKAGLFDGILGGGGAAAGLGEAGAALEGAGVAAEGAAAMLGPLAFIALPAVGFAVAGVSGEVHALTDVTSAYHKEAVKAGGELVANTSRLSTQLSILLQPIENAWDRLGVTMTEIMSKMVGDAARILEGPFGAPPPKAAPDEALAFHFVRPPDSADEASKSALSKIPKINVTNHVTINVQSNGDPSRIARLVHQEFQKKALYPTASKFVPIYDGLGSGG